MFTVDLPVELRTSDRLEMAYEVTPIIFSKGSSFFYELVTIEGEFGFLAQKVDLLTFGLENVQFMQYVNTTLHTLCTEFDSESSETFLVYIQFFYPVQYDGLDPNNCIRSWLRLGTQEELQDIAKIQVNKILLKSEGVSIEDTSNFLVSLFASDGNEILTKLQLDLTRPVIRYKFDPSLSS